MPTTTFTSEQIQEKLNNWTAEPLTERQLQYINSRLNEAPFEYAMDDIESLILELICEDEDNPELNHE